MTGAERGDRSLQVVIVSYCCEALLRSCLDSLRRHPSAGLMKVHVVDNASGDGTAEMVAREFPEVTLLVNDENRGFSAANNQAIRRGDSSFVLLLNPDASVDEGVIDRLLDVVDRRPRVAIAGPSLITPDGKLDHAAKRSFPTPLNALGHFTGIGRRPGARGKLATYTAPDVESGPVDAVNGAFMLIRRAALDQVGGLDEGYWMYMEDLDLCYRVSRVGWTTWYEPAAVARHVKAGSSGPVRSLRLNRAFHYGMYRFYRKHYAPDRSPLVNLSIYAGIAAKLALSVTGNAFRRLVVARRGIPRAAEGQRARITR